MIQLAITGFCVLSFYLWLRGNSYKNLLSLEKSFSKADELRASELRKEYDNLWKRMIKAEDEVEDLRTRIAMATKSLGETTMRDEP